MISKYGPREIREIRMIAAENGETEKVAACARALKGDADAFADVVVDDLVRFINVTALIASIK